MLSGASSAAPASAPSSALGLPRLASLFQALEVVRGNVALADVRQCLQDERPDVVLDQSPAQPVLGAHFGAEGVSDDGPGASSACGGGVFGKPLVPPVWFSEASGSQETSGSYT